MHERSAEEHMSECINALQNALQAAAYADAVTGHKLKFIMVPTLGAIRTGQRIASRALSHFEQFGTLNLGLNGIADIAEVA